MSPGRADRESMLSDCATALAGLLAAGVGSMVLVGWAIDHGTLKSLLPGWVTVKPNTAVAFVLTGIALLASRASAKRSVRVATALSRLSRLSGWLVGLIGLLTLVEYVSGWNPGLDQWLFPEPEGTLGTSHPGRMAPDTALCFALLAAGLELGRNRCRTIAMLITEAILGAVVMMLALTAIASYFTQVLGPFGWWGLTIMAVPTATVFAALGVTLTVIAWQGIRTAPEVPGKPIEAASKHARFAVLLAFLLLAAGVVTAGTSSYRAYEKRHRSEVDQQLSAIAELKASELTQWRKERLGDGGMLANNASFAALVRRTLVGPAAEAERGQLQQWISDLQAHYLYDRVALLDVQGVERLAVPDSPEPVSADLAEIAAQTRSSGRVAFWDFHRRAPDQSVRLGVLVPILNTPATATPLGVLVLYIDPAVYLYPLIQRWPTPSATGETLLVRREGGQVVFLNELRHHRGPALSLRLSVHDPQLPAARGAKGHAIIGEGVDYRGVKVLAVARAVPDSPWVMIAKVDQTEIHAALRREAGRMLGLTILLLMTTAFGVVAFWRQQNEAWLRDALRREREQKSLAERLAVVTRHANDIILLVDESGRIIEANDRAQAAYGYTLDEMRLLPGGGLRAATSDPFQEQFARFRSIEGAVFETVHRRRDGTFFPVEVSGRAVEIDGRHYSLGIYRDLTQRKAQEAEIERLNRLYTALSEVNQAIVRATTDDELYREVCRVLVEHGRFRLAWVGRVDPATSAMAVVGQAGDATGYLSSIRVFADDRPEGQGPTGTCIRAGQTRVCNDFAADPHTAHAHAAAARAGIAAAIALPIREQGVVRGALMAYAAEKNAFTPKEIALLEEAAVDVSFALDHLATDRQRRESEAALRRAERRYRSIFENAIEGIFQCTSQGTFIAANPALARILGYESPEALIRERTDIARRGFADPGRREELVRRIEADGIVNAFEYEAIRREGGKIWVSVNARVVRDEHGRVVFYEGSMEDITERRRAELALAESERRFQSLAEVSPAGIFRTDAHGGTTYVNPRWCQIAGVPAANAMGDGWLGAVHPADRARVAESWQAATAAQRASAVDFRFVHPDGSILWVMGQARPETDPSGRLIGYVGTVTDMTERKRHEAAMAEQLDELNRWHDAMLGRESRVLEVKQEVNALLARLGEPPRYGSADGEGSTVPRLSGSAANPPTPEA